MSKKLFEGEKEEKKEEVIKDAEVKEVKEEVKTPKMRQIVLETDGNSIRIIKAETSGTIELIGIFTNLINYLNKGKE